MKLRYAFALAATFAVAAPMGAAFAAPAYDARTLGMGNNSIGYSGNASLAYWNPASVAMGNRFGMFLPSVATSFSNNLLSPQDVMGLAGAMQGQGGGGPSNFGSLFTNLGSNTGLNLQADAFVEPLGLSLGQVGPGSMALRVYGHGLGFARARLTPEFADNLDGLFVQGGFQQITETIGAISAAANDPSAGSSQEMAANVDKLGNLLQSNMSSFIKRNGARTSAKTLDLDAVTSVNAAVAATYAQPVPLSLPQFPEGQLTVGATAKLFTSPFGSMGQAMVVPGSDGGKLSPLGGGVGANVRLDIDKEVTGLVDAIGRFQENQNLATTSNLMAKTGAFFSDGLGKSTIAFSSTTPDNVGVGFDLGAAYRFNRQFSVGLALTNPILLWGATKNTYKYDFSGDQIKVIESEERTSFYQAEPFVARLGGAYQPDWEHPLAQGFLFSAGVDAPLNNGFPPSVSLGAEKLFGPLALRLGTQQGGLAPLYTAGLGLQTSVFQMNLGVGLDSPSANAKGAAVAFSLGAGF